MLVVRGDTEEAVELLEGAPGDFVATGLVARTRLTGDADLDRAFTAWDDGDPETALELLQQALAVAAPDRRNEIRAVMVAIFTELGAEHPLAREHRRRLSAALN